jgi:hypothetical protein
MISLFGTGDFIRCDVKNPDVWQVGRVALMMGLVVSDNKIQGIMCGQDGQLGLVNAEDLVADFAYDADKDIFVDRSAKPPSGEDEEVPTV